MTFHGKMRFSRQLPGSNRIFCAAHRVWAGHSDADMSGICIPDLSRKAGADVSLSRAALPSCPSS